MLFGVGSAIKKESRPYPNDTGASNPTRGASFQDFHMNGTALVVDLHRPKFGAESLGLTLLEKQQPSFGMPSTLQRLCIDSTLDRKPSIVPFEHPAVEVAHMLEA